MAEFGEGALDTADDDRAGLRQHGALSDAQGEPARVEPDGNASGQQAAPPHKAVDLPGRKAEPLGDLRRGLGAFGGDLVLGLQTEGAHCGRRIGRCTGCLG
ncbi:hypothetical protein BJF79_21940 [Actinomadura sp. CNU-125]|nr:hypothetical protein BJF79_21940 [Actinomadura sp. CNU-125]